VDSRSGTLHIVDGFMHKLELPGFEVRSGEQFGLTAAFHVLLKTTVEKWVVENGRLVRTGEVAKDAPRAE
jgi:hypothetical protein